VVLAPAVLGASAAKIVEALTIVAASRVMRRWRSAIEGTIAVAVLLAAHVIAIGVPLARLVLIDTLRVSSSLCCSLSGSTGSESRCFDRAGTRRWRTRTRSTRER
jgi:uncharacterized membrane protein